MDTRKQQLKEYTYIILQIQIWLLILNWRLSFSMIEHMFWTHILRHLKKRISKITYFCLQLQKGSRQIWDDFIVILELRISHKFQFINPMEINNYFFFASRCWFRPSRRMVTSVHSSRLINSILLEIVLLSIKFSI